MVRLSVQKALSVLALSFVIRTVRIDRDMTFFLVPSLSSVGEVSSTTSAGIDETSNANEEPSLTENEEPSNGYMVFYPFGRFSNNAQQFRKMLMLARHLRRKLLIPPMHYNDAHEKVRTWSFTLVALVYLSPPDSFSHQ